MSYNTKRPLTSVSLGLVLLLALATSSALAHDFGGGTGPGGPPGGDGCPTCCGGGGCGGCGGGGDPVNFWDGAERYYFTDFVISGFFPLRFARGYDSQSTYDSPLGYGWSHGFSYRLYRFPDGRVILRKDCGIRREFIFSGGAFVTPVGEQGTLVDNMDGTYDFVEATGYTLKFDLNGRLERIDDVHGTSLRITYDEAGKLPLMGLSPFSPSAGALRVVSYDYRPTRIEEYDSSGASSGRYYDYAFDPITGRLTSVTDHTSRTWLFDHDANGNLESVTDPLSNVIGYSYADPNDVHNLTGIAGGPVDVAIAYDTEDRVISQTFGEIETNVTYTMPEVQTDVEILTREGPTVVASRNESYLFLADGLVDVYTDGGGNEVRWTRNTSGQPTLREYWVNSGGLALAESTVYTYDTEGLLMSEAETDHGSGETVTRTFTYDGGSVASNSEVSSADPTRIHYRDYTYEHAAGGVPLHVISYRRQINPGAVTPVYDETIMAYDDDGALTSISYPSGDTSNIVAVNGYSVDVDGVGYGRDLRGNITSFTLDSVTTTYSYDDLDRLSSVDVPGAGVTNYVYTGPQLTQIAYPTHTVDYGYDGAGRLRQVTQTVDMTPTTLADIVYDKAAGTATLTDASAAVHVFDWDPLRIWQRIENIETQNPRPSVFPWSTYIGPTGPDPLVEFFVALLDQPNINIPVGRDSGR